MVCLAELFNQRCVGMTPEQKQVAVSVFLDNLIQEMGLAIQQVPEEEYLRVISENSKIVEDYKKGNIKAIGALVGKIMKSNKGADAEIVKERLMEILK